MTVNFGQISLEPNFSLNEAILSWTFAYAGDSGPAEELLTPINGIPNILSTSGDVDYETLLQVQGTGSTDPTACASHPLIGISSLSQVYNVTAQRQIYNLFNENAVLYPDLAIGARIYDEGYSTLATQAIDPASSAYPHRDEFLVFFFETIVSEGDDDVAVEWAREVLEIFNSGQPNRLPTTYLNYAVGNESLESIYGYESWRLEKLRALKAKYDPFNRF